MTFILTNDDGIDAEGIKALQQAVNSHGESTIVAPSKQYSGCGHQITVYSPLKAEQRQKNAYAVYGTPADCVRLAVTEISPQSKWVLSGINAGGNLGVDIYMSGTVAAVREAAILGFPAIAFSQVRKYPIPVNWDWTTKITKKVLDLLLAKDLPKGSFWNVNLPPLGEDAPEPEIIFCPPSIDSLPVKFHKEGNLYHYQGSYHDRPVEKGTDVDACFSGNIAISLISLR